MLIVFIQSLMFSLLMLVSYVYTASMSTWIKNGLPRDGVGLGLKWLTSMTNYKGHEGHKWTKWTWAKQGAKYRFSNMDDIHYLATYMLHIRKLTS